jgi:large subunit ribosomal protein L4
VENIDLGEIKTKKIAGVLETLKTPKGALVVDDKSNENLRLSIRNLENSQFLPPEGVNVYDLLRYDHLVVSKTAAKALEARCLEKKS